MKRDHPFIGKTRDELDGKRWKKLGPAEKLLDFLKSRQTGPRGEVHYHKELGYAWIRSKIPNAPPERTLQRWMERLKECGEVVVSRTAYGMKIRLVNSRKWARQMKLFPATVEVYAAPVQNVLENSVNPLLRTAKSGGSLPPEVAAQRSSREIPFETSNGARAQRASSPVEKRVWNRNAKAIRIVGEIERLKAIVVGAGPSDRGDVARVEYRIELLRAELGRCGWQDERAG
ncbi:MAG TPA: hypothetical protein VGD60_00205 [Candidatus Acidoferrales bacterium]